MRKLAVLLLVAVILSGCSPIERNAYNTAVAAKAFLDSERKAHPECQVGATTTVCMDIQRAVGAKDLLIDAISAYCGGPNFNAGGACDAPKKGTPGAAQAAAKLQSAIANYNQTAADLKAATGGK